MDCTELEQKPLRNKPLKQLNRIAKRPPLDIEFQDLIYSIPDHDAKGGWRQLLKGVNGHFRSGELTAIMGPSGAGKSTLLNILAGYVFAGVQGSIKINDRPRDMKIFNKLSSYIIQEDIVQPRLTVRESMIYAASLKLGSHIKHDEKLAVVDEVIDLLGLVKCYDTRSEHLSGGQRKRLAVALELVNNPPVIFLDEPTTGLDNFAIKKCMDLLQRISKLGRTVICTIHQPPASLFQTFDQVYILANGSCIYNGSPSQLVPFLSNAGCPCPQNNTPADYILEIVHNDSTIIPIFAQLIQNGKNNMRLTPDDKSMQIQYYHQQYSDQDIEVYNETTQDGRNIQESDIEFPTSYLRQCWLLFSRMALQTSRNRTMLYIQFFHHLLSSLLIGGVFFGTGNNASQTIATFKYCVCCNVVFMYTYVMSPVLLFPLEMKLMKREYYNRWYSLRAYYTALTFSTIPLMVILVVMFSTIVYIMTDQPMEIGRYIGFTAMGLIVSLASQGLGYAIGSVFSITAGSIAAPSILAPLLALGFYGMGYRSDVAPFMKFLMSLDYLRYGIVGICNAIFFERGRLECFDELYCHYSHPDVLMLDMGMPLMHYTYQLGAVVGFTFLFRIISFICMKVKLNSELSNKIVYIAKKVIKQRY